MYILEGDKVKEIIYEQISQILGKFWTNSYEISGLDVKVIRDTKKKKESQITHFMTREYTLTML